MLIGEFDAKIWATEFVKTVNKHPEITKDIETMTTWFANAIMSGYDKAKCEMSLQTFIRTQVGNRANGKGAKTI